MVMRAITALETHVLFGLKADKVCPCMYWFRQVQPRIRPTYMQQLHVNLHSQAMMY